MLSLFFHIDRVFLPEFALRKDVQRLTLQFTLVRFSSSFDTRDFRFIIFCLDLQLYSCLCGFPNQLRQTRWKISGTSTHQLYLKSIYFSFLFFFLGGVLVPHLCGLIPVRPDLEMGGEYCLTKEVLIISPK